MATVIRRLTGAYQAAQRALPEWAQKHSETVDELIENYLPSGSGFDQLPSLEEATNTTATIKGHYHAMSEYGFYIGWVEFTVKVAACFDGIDLDVEFEEGTDLGEEYDLEGLKDFIGDSYQFALTQKLGEPVPAESSN